VGHVGHVGPSLMWLCVHALPHEVLSRQTVYGECSTCVIEEDWAVDVHKQDIYLHEYVKNLCYAGVIGSVGITCHAHGTQRSL